MTLLYDKIVSRNFTVTSNYVGNTVTSVPQKQVTISGSGVQKRLNWKKIPLPAKLTPLAYWKEWSDIDHGNYIYNHTERSGASFFYKYEAGPYQAVGFPSNSIIPGVLDSAEYIAKARLLEQMKGEGANLANMLGERKQVAATVLNTMTLIGNAARDLRRGNIASAIRRFGGDPRTARKLRGKDIANQWLSLQYGWKPLLSDVYDVVNGLHHRESNIPKVFRVSHKIRRVGSSDSSWAFAGTPSKNYGIRSTEAICKYMIRARPDKTFAEPAALGFTNPLTVLWEVTPWSFVVDWFWPIGTYLEQLSADHGWYFHDGCKSTLVRGAEQALYNYTRSYTSAGWTYYDSWNWYGGLKYARFDRSTLSSFPNPSAPRFKNPFSIAHFANGLALLSQAFGGNKRFRYAGSGSNPY